MTTFSQLQKLFLTILRPFSPVSVITSDPVDITEHNVKNAEIDNPTSALDNSSPAPRYLPRPRWHFKPKCLRKSAAEIDDPASALDKSSLAPVISLDPIDISDNNAKEVEINYFASAIKIISPAPVISLDLQDLEN